MTQLPTLPVDARHAARKALPPFDTAPACGAPSYVGLQYLRAVAALLVVYYHAVLQVNNVYGHIDWPLFGRCGVDIFFVLSGFVMWTSTATRQTTPDLFLRRRIARIVPLYWMVTICASLIALVVPNLLRSTKFDLPHLLASLLFVPWSNPVAVAKDLSEKVVPVVVPGWTLNFEMLFYLLFALALLMPRTRRSFGVIILIAMVYFAARAMAPLGAAPEFYAQTIIFEFVFGVLLAVVTMHGWSVSPALSILMLMAGFAALVVLDAVRLPLDRLAALGMPALLIVAATVSLEQRGWMPNVRLPDALGNASYSIYLVHIYVIAMLRVGFDLAGLQHWSPLEPVFVIASVILSAIAGLASYRWLEIPVVLRTRKLLRV